MYIHFMPYMALEKETCCTWNGYHLCHCSEVSSFYILICCGQKPMQGVDVVFGVVFNAELFFLNPIKLFFYTFFFCVPKVSCFNWTSNLKKIKTERTVGLPCCLPETKMLFVHKHTYGAPSLLSPIASASEVATAVRA